MVWATAPAAIGLGTRIASAGRPLWNLLSKPFRGHRPAMKGGAGAGYRTTLGTFPPAVPERLAGALNPKAHPYRAGAAGLTTAALTLPWMFRGGEEDQGQQIAYDTSGYSDWQPPQDLDSYIKHQEKQRVRSRKMIAKMMQQYMVVSFTGGEGAAKNYLEMADKLMKADTAFSEDTRGAKLYDAVFGDKDNLPANSEETYNRFITAGAAPAHAAEMSGYIGEAKKADVAAVGKQSTRERVLERIRQIYATDQDMGIRAMVEAWMTGTLDEKPIGDYETLLQKAAEVLSGVPAAEASGGGGITSIRMAS